MGKSAITSGTTQYVNYINDFIHIKNYRKVVNKISKVTNVKYIKNMN